MTATESLPLFVWGETYGAIKAKEAAIAQVDVNADELWRTEALSAVMKVARKFEVFNTDDVWPLIRPGFKTSDPRALGPIMRAAMKEGIVEPTDQYRQSLRAINHGRPLRMWKSKIKDD